MPLSVILFLALLLAVAAMRIVELRISKRHQQDMAARGAAKAKDPIFRWMATFHTLVLVGAAAEVVLLGRPFLPANFGGRLKAVHFRHLHIHQD